MTPQQKIKKLCKTNKDQLKICFKIINYYLCDEDIEHYLEIKRKK